MNNLKYKIKYEIPNTLKSIILCIRFPFLYPRNRWTGKHYTNWNIHNYHVKYFNEAFSAIPLKEIKHKEQVVGERYPNYSIFELFTINPGKKFLAYKILFLDWINDHILPIFHCIPTYNELEAMPDGWRNVFGIQMCKEIKAELKKYNVLYKYRITQIKEKMAYLHWYDNGYYGSAESKIPEIIDKYAKLSLKICINCGKPATKYTCGYVLPYCDDCASKQVYKTYKKYETALNKIF